MSCCGKQQRVLPANPGPATLGLKDLDFWIYTGFDGLVNLFQKRGVGNPLPLSKENLELLKNYIEAFDNHYQTLNNFPEKELTNDESDQLLLKCLGTMLTVLHKRTEDPYKHKETLQVLKNNLDRMKGILLGFEASEYRAQNPYDQGIRDAKGGWGNRGSKLYGHAHEVQQYEQGYSSIKKL